MERWRGKTAFVTGASAGIGAAVAETLALAGVKVAGCGRRLGRLEALREKLAGQGAIFMPLELDLRDEAQTIAGFDAIRSAWGGVDILVNNAGLGHKAPLLSGQTSHWREMLEVNVLALCVCTREAAADMRRRGDDGHIIHISSMSAHRVPKSSGVYSATKFAVRSLTEGLRMELREAGSSIRVTAISPGFVETEFAAHYSKSEEAARLTYSRFKVLDPQDVANSVVYVLEQPPHVQLHDLLMRPTAQPS